MDDKVMKESQAGRMREEEEPVGHEVQQLQEIVVKKDDVFPVVQEEEPMLQPLHRAMEQYQDPPAGGAGEIVGEVQRREINSFPQSEEDHGSRRERCDHRAKQKRILEFSSIITTISSAALVALFSLQSNSLHLAICALFIFISLLCGLCLMFHSMQILTLTLSLISTRHHTISNTLIYLSILSLILAVSLSLSLLLPKSSIYLAATLLPVLPPVGVLLYVGPVDAGQELYERHKKDLKISCRLASSITSLSFGGLVGTFLAYPKGFSSCVRAFCFLASFTFFSGLSLTSLSATPPSFSHPTHRDLFVAAVKILCNCLLGLLAVTEMVVSAIFLKYMSVAALVPLLLVAVVWCFMEFCLKGTAAAVVEQRTQERELKIDHSTSTTLTSIAFGGIMSVFAGLVGGEADFRRHAGVCVFLMSSAFACGLSLVLLVINKPPKNAISVVNILTSSTIGLLAMAWFALFRLVVLTS